MGPMTLFDKLWDRHVVAELDGGYDLLHVDRHLLHDLSGPGSLRALARRGLPVHSPDLTVATADHTVSSDPDRTAESTESGRRLLPVLRERCAAEGVQLFDLGGPEQGIVHVIGPELGLTVPGTLIVCGDSHTCTHGAFGALAWGIGTSEVTHVLATQCVIERKPKRLRIQLDGRPSPSVSAKDLALHLLSRLGTEIGVGHAVEYAGPVVESLDMEGRMTLCNLSIELGSKMGLIAPDETTLDYVAGRTHAPTGDDWQLATEDWLDLHSDDGAVFDADHIIDVSGLEPQITWGTNPGQGGSADEPVPDPADAPDAVTAASVAAAIEYMGLEPGRAVRGLAIDHVFIGSCTNARLGDLLSAAAVVEGGQVAPGVEAWVVPGSMAVKREAERMGLHEVFRRAGFEWREPGCSRCVATNGEYVPSGGRCVSTSNRNFVGRQGPGARTHLASPATAAASALAGHLTTADGGQL